MVLRSISLCSGIGGIDLGLMEWARTVCYVERDGFAASVIVARMEDKELDLAPIWSDMERFDARAWRGAVDLVTAGFPCPPFSIAGKQLGAEDERFLWPLVRRIAVQSGSPLLFLENVGGALRHPDGLGSWLADLARLGFDAEWTTLRASDVEAPHSRERIFALAYRRHELQHVLKRGARDESEGGSGELADSERDHSERRRATGNMDSACEAPEGETRERERGWNSANCRSGSVEHASGARLEGRRLPIRARTQQRVAFPPGPQGDWSGWNGPLPCVRRDSDGLQGRVDRLRCLGNAVVPQQARAAFAELIGRIT